MKKWLLFLGLLPVFNYAQESQFQLGAFTSLEVPIHAVMPKMSANFGTGFQFAYKPFRFIPVSLELRPNFGMYSNQTRQETYVFSDSSSTQTDVTYSSAMNKIMFGTKFHIGNEYQKIRGFITPQIGVNFMKSRIVIADPADEDDCHPLERNNTHRFSGLTYGGQMGVELDFSLLFKNTVIEGRHKLYASATYLGSFQKFEYINVKHMMDHTHMTTHSGTSSATDTQDLNAQFINVSSNNTHEHKIAEVYRTNLSYWGINIGYVFYF